MAEMKIQELDLKPVHEIIEKHREKGHRALIAILQQIQEVYGFLPEAALNVVTSEMRIPKAKIYGVCTFYSQFRLKPLGKYIIQVCDGTACHVRGSMDLIKELQAILGINAGDTTEDGLFSLEVVNCIGACSLAPAMVVGEDTYAKLTPKMLGEIVDKYRKRG